MDFPLFFRLFLERVAKNAHTLGNPLPSPIFQVSAYRIRSCCSFKGIFSKKKIKIYLVQATLHPDFPRIWHTFCTSMWLLMSWNFIANEDHQILTMVFFVVLFDNHMFMSILNRPKNVFFLVFSFWRVSQQRQHLLIWQKPAGNSILWFEVGVYNGIWENLQPEKQIRSK